MCMPEEELMRRRTATLVIASLAPISRFHDAVVAECWGLPACHVARVSRSENGSAPLPAFLHLLSEQA
jgi:hypothetical protein